MKTVCTEDSKKAVCGKYVSDLTMVPSVETSEQLQTVACAMRKLLSNMGNASEDLADFADCFQQHLFEILSDEMQHTETAYRQWWLDEVRKEDLLMGLLRMRGVRFA